MQQGHLCVKWNCSMTCYRAAFLGFEIAWVSVMPWLMSEALLKAFCIDDVLSRCYCEGHSLGLPVPPSSCHSLIYRVC